MEKGRYGPRWLRDDDDDDDVQIHSSSSSSSSSWTLVQAGAKTHCGYARLHHSLLSAVSSASYDHELGGTFIDTKCMYVCMLGLQQQAERCRQHRRRLQRTRVAGANPPCPRNPPHPGHQHVVVRPRKRRRTTGLTSCLDVCPTGDSAVLLSCYRATRLGVMQRTSVTTEHLPACFIVSVSSLYVPDCLSLGYISFSSCLPKDFAVQTICRPSVVRRSRSVRFDTYFV